MPHRFICLAGILLAFLLSSGCVDSGGSGTAQPYSIDESSRLHFNSGRGNVAFNETDFPEPDSLVLDIRVDGAGGKKVFFNGTGGVAAGLLWVPDGGPSKKPALVYLPGALVAKEAGLGYARLLAPQGIAVLSLDQPGVGETGYKFNSPDEDFGAFQTGGLPSQYSYFHDAVLAYDYLAQRSDIDASRIMIAGESMGGRAAIIAAAVEPRFRGVLAVSTAGYGRPQVQDANATRFIRSMDPDNYLLALPPRRIAFIHSANDRVIPVADARRSFNLAGRPKSFSDVDCANHGYCREMDAVIVQRVLEILGGQ
ncbi:MAG: alpha/beta hydrolase [Candidatus Micrarchaeota archaeon]